MRSLILIFMVCLVAYAYTDNKKKNPVVEEVDDLREMLRLQNQMKTEIDRIFNNDDIKDSIFGGLGDIKMELGSDFIETTWEETTKERILKIKPKDKNTNLDISIKDGFISIKSKTEQKDQSKGQMISSFSQSFNVPEDVDEKKAKIDQKGEEIIVIFPLRFGKSLKQDKIEMKKDDDDLRPLKSSPSDVTI